MDLLAEAIQRIKSGRVCSKKREEIFIAESFIDLFNNINNENLIIDRIDTEAPDIVFKQNIEVVTDDGKDLQELGLELVTLTEKDIAKINATSRRIKIRIRHEVEEFLVENNITDKYQITISCKDTKEALSKKNIKTLISSICKTVLEHKNESIIEFSPDIPNIENIALKKHHDFYIEIFQLSPNEFPMIAHGVDKYLYVDNENDVKVLSDLIKRALSKKAGNLNGKKSQVYEKNVLIHFHDELPVYVEKLELIEQAGKEIKDFQGIKNAYLLMETSSLSNNNMINRDYFYYDFRKGKCT